MQAPAEKPNSLPARMIRAARLDGDLYREVALDARAMPQAILVVLAAGLLSGLGGLAGGFDVVLTSVMLAPFGWLITSFLAYVIGRRVMGAGGASLEAVARALGFAHAPALIGVLAVIPTVGILIAVALICWRLAAMTVAIRSSMAIATGPAVMIIILSMVTLGVIAFTVDWIATGGAPAL
ncbi:MAG: YIP1 family protein [Dehalococcoidia bacterium]